MRPKTPFILLALLLALAATLTALGPAKAAPTVNPPTEGLEALPAGATIQTVVSDLDAPIAMAFDPAGRLFVSLKGGTVRLISAAGVLQTAPVMTFNVDDSGEQGLLGIALDPAFNSNHYIYVYYTSVGPSGGSNINNVVRFVENNGAGSNPQTIFTSPDDTAATNHNGGNLHFGGDGKLYISIGDDGVTPANAQDVTVKNGKIHRINANGTIPADNPVFTQTGALPSLFAMGVRNSFDFDFDPTNDTMWASENGPSCDDELNHILGGNNYGWRPGYPCDDDDPSATYNTIPAEWWLPNGRCCEAPTGTEFYTGSQIAAWHNELFMCSYSTGIMRHMHLNGARSHVTSVGDISGVTCNMDMASGPDGALYYMEGGGYGLGTIKRIVGNNPTFTPTRTPTQAPATATPSRTATATVTRTATSSATATVTRTRTVTPTGTPPTVTPTVTPCPINFSDVHPADFFYEPVRYLYCARVISGYADNTFRPFNSTTRGQVAKIIALAEGFTIAPPATPTFSDVHASNPFYGYIEAAVARGVVNGYNRASDCAPLAAPCFKPSNNVTRGQLSKIVVLAEGWTLLNPATPTFSDVGHDNPFYKEIETAANHGIIAGYDDHTFRWGNSATRGQIAKIVYNAITAP